LGNINIDFKNKIIKFWEWFESISQDLLLDPTRKDLISQLDNSVSRLGSFGWEMGPLKENICYFAISPNLDVERLKITRQIIDLSIKCKGWDFLPSKPAKYDWKGIWKMRNDFGKEILVNSNKWEYILYEFDDKTFDMDILIGGVDGDLNTCYSAIDIALTGYLGEEEFMRLIKNIKIVDVFEAENKDKATQLKYIKNHIESIIR
jgi:hypothetical protein